MRKNTKTSPAKKKAQVQKGVKKILSRAKANPHLVGVPREICTNVMYRFSDPEITKLVKVHPTQDTKVDFKKIHKSFLHALLQEEGLPASLKTKIFKYIGKDASSLLDCQVDSPREAFRMLHAIGVDKVANPKLEYCINGRWYPISVTPSFHSSLFGQMLSLRANLQISDASESFDATVTSHFFSDGSGHSVKRSIKEVLHFCELRFTTPEAIQAFKLHSMKTETFSKVYGKVMTVSGSVLELSDFFWQERLTRVSLGSPLSPSKVIVECDLESKKDGGGYSDEEAQDIPLVRCFSLDLKKYVYADVDDLQPYEFTSDSTDRLIVPEDIRSIITKVFNTKSEALFSDMFPGRHGGMVILANGPSGVGKTLTAEVFAECTSRPLYVMEMGELGTTLVDVEKNLRRVFARSARWNAVLLFDEADVFMAKRDQNLERNAIVAVFLRLLDYYKGMFFLTSNRGETIDEAFGSRITLSLDYPELNEETRSKIWTLLLQAANLTLCGNVSEVAKEPLNGRQIRNVVRLLSTINDGSRMVEIRSVQNLFKYTLNSATKKRAAVKSNGQAASEGAQAVS